MKGDAAMRASRCRAGRLASGPGGARSWLAEGWAARERVGRGWTEREVWAEPVWRGFGRSVGELGRAERVLSFLGLGSFFYSLSLSILFPLFSILNSNKV